MQTYASSSKEAELLLNTVLSHIRNQEIKLKFVSLWAEKEVRTYLNTVDQDKKESLKTMLDTLEDGQDPNLMMFTQLKTLNQGYKTLSTYIEEVRRMVDLYNFSCVGDCKDRLIQNFIVAGLNSTKVYQQCISKVSSLTLNDCIKICQTGCHMQTGSSPMFRVYRLC